MDRRSCRGAGISRVSTEKGPIQTVNVCRPCPTPAPWPRSSSLDAPCVRPRSSIARVLHEQLEKARGGSATGASCRRPRYHYRNSSRSRRRLRSPAAAALHKGSSRRRPVLIAAHLTRPARARATASAAAHRATGKTLKLALPSGSNWTFLASQTQLNWGERGWTKGAFVQNTNNPPWSSAAIRISHL